MSETPFPQILLPWVLLKIPHLPWDLSDSITLWIYGLSMEAKCRSIHMWDPFLPSVLYTVW